MGKESDIFVAVLISGTAMCKFKRIISYCSYSRMEAITLKMLELQLEKYKKIDLEKKIDIAANIFERVHTPSAQEATSTTVSYSIDKIADLTGVNIAILQEIRKLEDVSRKFKEWANEQELRAGMSVLYKTMIAYLQYLYTDARKIPTKSGLVAGSRIKIKSEFNTHLNKYFTRIRVPGTQYSTIVEKPEIVLSRQKYLRKKMELVRDQKVFVYIEDISFQGRKSTSLKLMKPKTDATKRLLLAVSPELGFVSSIYFCRTVRANLYHWLDEKVIPNLPSGCVLVVEERIFGDVSDLPLSHAPKQVMINWLTDRDIPHDPRSHRAELYTLIETYKKTYTKISKLDEILRQHGHTALCREEGVVFEYFEPFWKKLKLVLNPKKGEKHDAATRTRLDKVPFKAKKVASMIKTEYWKGLHKKLLNTEMNAYKKDQEVEEVIDKLMTYFSSEKIDPGETEFDDYCDAASQEYIYNY